MTFELASAVSHFIQQARGGPDADPAEGAIWKAALADAAKLPISTPSQLEHAAAIGAREFEVGLLTEADLDAALAKVAAAISDHAAALCRGEL